MKFALSLEAGRPFFMPAIATKAIVLSSLRYGDSSLIVRLYTEASGLQSFMLKGILGRRRGAMSAGLFQPLTQLEVVAVPSRSGKLGYLREAGIGEPYTTVHSEVRKSTIAMFLSEVLSQSIQEESPNLPLFKYLQHSLQWLDHHDRIANFHIYFMLGLSRYLGFYPDMENREAPYFDLQEGAFTPDPALNPSISGENLLCFKSFLGIKFDEIDRIRMTHDQRSTLLKSLVEYFQIHLQGFRKPRSLAVLDEVFS